MSGRLLPVSRVLFWEPSKSPHKTRFFEAFSKLNPACAVQALAYQDVVKDRRLQGWEIDGELSVEWIIDPDDDKITSVVDEATEETLHILSGIRWVPMLVKALNAVKKSGVRFAIMHEPRVREGWKGELRFIQSWLTEGWLRSNAEFVLAIGKNGPPWFYSVGYKRDKIFPFAYFVDPPPQFQHISTPQIENCIRIGYVGRLVKTKGVFHLLEAVSLLKQKADLSFVGMGVAEDALKLQASANGVPAHFMGVVPITEIGKVMAQFDVLVLASTTKDDGWGVVVSEALMCGTAVVCTPQVGASLMMGEALFGKCVSVGQPQAIADAICSLEMSGAFSEEQRQRRQQVAIARLSAEAGARYFTEIISAHFSQGLRPTPFYEYRAP